MIKMRAKPGVTSVSVEGHVVEVGTDGSVMVNERDAETLRAHGFVRWKEADAIDRRADVLAKLSALSTDDLEALLELAESGATTLDVSEVTEADIEGMKRNELFAFLREKGVSAPPTSNEKLRELARGALAGQSPIIPAAGAQA